MRVLGLGLSTFCLCVTFSRCGHPRPSLTVLAVLVVLLTQRNKRADNQAFPAVFTIDTFGRRSLLLATFPNMAWTLLAAGMMFFIDESKKVLRTGLIAFFIYLFAAFYSVGEGPGMYTFYFGPSVCERYADRPSPLHVLCRGLPSCPA